MICEVALCNDECQTVQKHSDVALLRVTGSRHKREKEKDTMNVTVSPESTKVHAIGTLVKLALLL